MFLNLQLAHWRAVSAMADPFSIIAVTQTGLTVAQALTKLIQGLRSLHVQHYFSLIQYQI